MNMTVNAINTITFGSYITDHIFRVLREYHLKFLLGGYTNFESELQQFLTVLKKTLPVESAAREAFSQTELNLTCSAKEKESTKNPESATALNVLAQQIYGKSLLPMPNEITMNYLVTEFQTCPSNFPAYKRWLRITQKKLYKKRSKRGIHALNDYFNTMAKTFRAILLTPDGSHANYHEAFELLQELKNFEQTYAKQYIFHSGRKVHPSLLALATDIQDKDISNQNYLRYLLHFAFEQHLLYDDFNATRIMYLLNMLANCQTCNTPDI